MRRARRHSVHSACARSTRALPVRIAPDPCFARAVVTRREARPPATRLDEHLLRVPADFAPGVARRHPHALCAPVDPHVLDDGLEVTGHPDHRRAGRCWLAGWAARDLDAERRMLALL